MRTKLDCGARRVGSNRIQRPQEKFRYRRESRGIEAVGICAHNRAGIPNDRQKAIARCAKSRQTPANCVTVSKADVVGVVVPDRYSIRSEIQLQSA